MRNITITETNTNRVINEKIHNNVISEFFEILESYKLTGLLNYTLTNNDGSRVENVFYVLPIEVLNKFDELLKKEIYTLNHNFELGFLTIKYKKGNYFFYEVVIGGSIKQMHFKDQPLEKTDRKLMYLMFNRLLSSIYKEREHNATNANT